MPNKTCLAVWWRALAHSRPRPAVRQAGVALHIGPTTHYDMSGIDHNASGEVLWNKCRGCDVQIFLYAISQNIYLPTYKSDETLVLSNLGWFSYHSPCSMASAALPHSHFGCGCSHNSAVVLAYSTPLLSVWIVNAIALADPAVCLTPSLPLRYRNYILSIRATVKQKERKEKGTFTYNVCSLWGEDGTQKRRLGYC